MAPNLVLAQLATLAASGVSLAATSVAVGPPAGWPSEVAPKVVGLVTRRGRTWSACRCHVFPSGMPTSSDETLAGDSRSPADQGGPGRKFLVKTGAPDSGKDPGRHPRLAASFCFNCFRSAVDRRSGCRTNSSPRDTAMTTWDRTGSRLVASDIADLKSTSGYACSSMNTLAGSEQQLAPPAGAGG
ncbi:hypothetical protein HPB49_008989 [Dermacentor silvarum]|uniref:Uncharacterized protein n=1 Tax=Dermacentor silvarum TaxID=543639 RepID=A0ACB8DBS9_DERSI|nr:hypothetical protein HPB49_008989 [Dermacentor silvarum]